MRVTRFEDLIAWQKARELRKTIYSASADGFFERDFEMKDQIRSAALSVMTNVAEGFERNTLKEFLYYMRIARASCGEVRSQLYAAFDEGYLSNSSFESLLEKTGEVCRVIRGLEISISKKLGTRH